MSEDFRLKQAFIESSRAYYTAISDGDVQEADKKMSTISNAQKKILELGTNGVEILQKLLGHDEIPVRYMAAVYVLDIKPEESIRTLVEILEGPPSPIRMLAMTTLKHKFPGRKWY